MRARRLADLDDLIARRHDRDPRTPVDQHARAPHRRQQRDFSVSNADSGRKHHVTAVRFDALAD